MSYRCDVPPVIFTKYDKNGNRYFVDDDTVDLPGLEYYPDFITEEEEQQILDMLDSRKWYQEIVRRQQHYGYMYYHTRHNLPLLQPKDQPEETELSGTMEDFDWLVERFDKLNIFPEDHPINQCLVNEYIGNQGICGHVDNPACFGDVIAAISLKDPVYMMLRKEDEPEIFTKIFLESRSLMIMKDEVRFLFRHGITKQKKVFVPTTKQCLIRDNNFRRVSLTFREIKVDGTKKVDDSDSDDPELEY
eukprot:TRINITY_DN1112_c0_g1_i1.p1 TRINITY_DN1112_c0_g1~~TRINITY_DN1112_c0_g1_i1.p1  ORF type:complete len:247 (+),score=85.60 TRINITY_DN1112_c0_g1_i1:147-887(+)